MVGCGPGPFTGLRVGMATAAAYGHALGVPVFGVCSLDAIGGQTAGEVLVVTDARRREVYWARYADGVRVDGPGVAAAADARRPSEQVAGSPQQCASFDLPTIGPARPTPVGLVAAVVDWDAEPAPWCLCTCAVRMPKTLAERAGPNGERPGECGLRRTDPAGLLPLRRTGGAAVRRRRPVGRRWRSSGSWPPGTTVTSRRRVADTLVGYAGIARLGRVPPSNTRFTPSGWIPRTSDTASGGP